MAALCINPPWWRCCGTSETRPNGIRRGETICPHPSGGTQQAQAVPGVCCPRRRCPGLPFDTRPPFPPHRRAAMRCHTSSGTRLGWAAGGARVLLFLLQAHSPMGRINHSLTALSWITASTKKRIQIWWYSGDSELHVQPLQPGKSFGTTTGSRATYHPQPAKLETKSD